MTQTTANPRRLSQGQVETAARHEVRRAVGKIVSDFGGQTAADLRTTTVTWPGFNDVDPEPIAQIEAAHAIEQAAHALIKDYIRLARQAGRTWHEIGQALDLHWQAVIGKESIAETAYSTALDYQSGTGIRIFTWTCPACQQLITDQYPFREFPAQEEGHADDCGRRAAQLAEWQKHQHRDQQ